MVPKHDWIYYLYAHSIIVSTITDLNEYSMFSWEVGFSGIPGKQFESHKCASERLNPPDSVKKLWGWQLKYEEQYY